MNVRRFALWTIAALAISFAILLAGGFWAYRSDVHSSGLEAASEWARMSPLPESAYSVRVSTRGGPFTREFTILFRATPADIARWIETSPGTTDVTPVDAGTTHTYTIDPGGGAMHAEVTVDDGSNTVVIHTYWS